MFLEDMDIDVVRVVFDIGIDNESVALGVAEGAGLERFMGSNKEATINLEGAKVEGVCAVCEVQ